MSNKGKIIKKLAETALYQNDTIEKLIEDYENVCDKLKQYQNGIEHQKIIDKDEEDAINYAIKALEKINLSKDKQHSRINKCKNLS